jgi:hypothetical protein
MAPRREPSCSNRRLNYFATVVAEASAAGAGVTVVVAGTTTVVGSSFFEHAASATVAMKATISARIIHALSS